MKKITDRICKLLYGWNYQVSLAVCGPFSMEIPLQPALEKFFAKKIIITDRVPTSMDEMQKEIVGCLLWAGCSESSCPLDLDRKKPELLQLIRSLLNELKVDQAELWFLSFDDKGHPFYPVFWDFSFEIILDNQRQVLIGSCSD